MKSVKDINVIGKTVFVRVDYNLPMDENNQITDDNRIVATLPLINYLIENKAKIILASHMGRPKGAKDPALSLAPAAKKLSELINKNVSFIDDCIGESVKLKVDSLVQGDILLLENLRFHNEEKDNDENFAKQLASLCDIYVNEAFAVSHREQASVTTIARFAPISAAGFLLEKELKSFHDSVKNPVRPLVSVIGGAKVSTKLEALENMINFVDTLIIGGAMANTFLKSQGIDTKGSMIEEDLLETASKIVDNAKEKGVGFLLPVDLVAAQKFDKDSLTKEVDVNSIPDEWMALDIGIKTARIYSDIIKNAGTIVWNGPMGVFEMEKFMVGTKTVAQAVAQSKGFSIVGGGDTVLAAKYFKIENKVGYISTGGGAFLHLMEGKQLPGVTALE